MQSPPQAARKPERSFNEPQRKSSEVEAGRQRVPSGRDCCVQHRHGHLRYEAGRSDAPRKMTFRGAPIVARSFRSGRSFRLPFARGGPLPIPARAEAEPNCALQDRTGWRARCRKNRLARPGPRPTFPPAQTRSAVWIATHGRTRRGIQPLRRTKYRFGTRPTSRTVGRLNQRMTPGEYTFTNVSLGNGVTCHSLGASPVCRYFRTGASL